MSQGTGASLQVTTLLSLIALAACGDLKAPTAPAAEPQPPRQHQVTVTSFQFTPSRLEIAPGDRVVWRNLEGFHNVQADDGSFRCAEGCDGEGGDGDPAASQWSVVRTFPVAGDVRYFCEVHGGPGGSGMAGVISVRAGA